MENNQLCQNIYVANHSSIDSKIINNILTKFELYVRRYNTRKQLKKLSIEQLCDIGISAEQVLKEVQKPFWK